MVRTRFAPSPTGYVHVGNLRTVLYAYFIAHKDHGKCILRIEDTDRTRLVEDGVERLIQAFDWLKIKFDEGPHIGGDFGPYTQSQRLDIYNKYAQELIDKDQAYYCFCTKEELEQERKGNQQEMYSGKCRFIDKEEAKKRVANGEECVIRLKVPKSEEVEYVDEVYGKVKFDTNTIDDQVLMKSDGYPTYHMAVVVDDHLMEITHVVRANEWIPSMGKHILLYRAFDWKMPKHVHLPMITGDDGKKLSKRKGDVFIESFRKKGYLAEVLINFLALLGWNPGDNREIFSLDELVKEFKVERIKKSNAFFDYEKLNWMNKQYMMKMSAEEIVERLADIELSDYVKNLDKDLLTKIVEVEKSRMTTLADINNIGEYFTSEPKINPDDLVFKKSDIDRTKAGLTGAIRVLTDLDDWRVDSIMLALKQVVEADGSLGNGDVFWPVRYALSGEMQSSSPPELLWVLGKEESLKRLNKAVELL